MKHRIAQTVGIVIGYAVVFAVAWAVLSACILLVRGAFHVELSTTLLLFGYLLGGLIAGLFIGTVHGQGQGKLQLECAERTHIHMADDTELVECGRRCARCGQTWQLDDDATVWCCNHITEPQYEVAHSVPSVYAVAEHHVIEPRRRA